MRWALPCWGAGGGGDPYYGKLMAIGAIKERGAVDLISPDEVPDDAVIMPIAMMGAPHRFVRKGHRRQRISGDL